MQNKKELAKLLLAGLLVTASVPATIQANNFSGNETYLAVAGCGGCGGKPTSPDTSKTTDSQSPVVSQTKPHANHTTPTHSDTTHVAPKDANEATLHQNS